MGGYIVGTRSLGFNSYAYIKNTVDFLQFDDVTSGLIKAAVFGFIIAIMGCYHGFNSKGGAQGVGRATTNAVVSARRSSSSPPTSSSPRCCSRSERWPNGHIVLQDVRKAFGPKQVLNGIDLSVPQGPFAGGDRRLRHRQVGDDQMHPRHPPRPIPARSRSAARRSSASRARRATNISARFGMLFQGARTLRLACPSGRMSPSA